MRKTCRILFLTAVILIVFCCAYALAEDPEGPVNPERMIVENHSQVEGSAYPILRSSRLFSLASTDEVTWTMYRTGTVGYNSTCVFNVEASDGGSYQYEFYFGEYNSIFGNSWVVYCQRMSTLNTFSLCPIVVPGEYRVIVNVYDIEGKKRLKQLQYRYVVEEDEDHPSLDTICDNILAECLGATDFDTALNLHDWITHHAYYDNSLSYYGADGVLVRGYGVCDSYSKAYYLLLDKAGIPVARQGGNNHAWNRICLDGQWYQVDTTWDDNAPKTCVSPVSGLENHEYFCITDALMKASGHTYNIDDGYACESLTMNYFAVRGSWDEWQIGFLDELRAGMALGRPGLGALCPEETMRHLTILCSILNEQPEWTADMAEGQSLLFRYDYGDSVFSVALADAGSLSGNWMVTLADGSATVGAWLGVRTVLAVPTTLEGMPVTAIADRVFFGDTHINSLSLPQTITSIGESALPEGYVLTCGKSTSLAKALGSAGYTFIDPEIPDWMLQWTTDEVLAAVSYSGGTDTVSLPEGVNGLGVLDLGDTALLRTGNAVIWTNTDSAALSAPAILLCSSSNEALAEWCDLNGTVLLTESDRTILPGSLQTIEEEAFYGDGFRWVVIPAQCTEIGESAFAGCDSLVLVEVPMNTTSIGDNAFTAGTYLLTPSGSDAATWAAANGLNVLTE